MSPESLITLYHSTDRMGLEAAKGTGRVYGIEKLHKYRPGYSGGSNLTPDRAASIAFIKAYRTDGQWRYIDGPPELFLLTFVIPNRLVKAIGKIPLGNKPMFTNGAEEWATTLTVEVDMLPDQYLQNLHAGMHQMTRDQAREKWSRGDIRFYEMPMDFLTTVEPVEYEYKGVKYPLNSPA